MPVSPRAGRGHRITEATGLDAEDVDGDAVSVYVAHLLGNDGDGAGFGHPGDVGDQGRCRLGEDAEGGDATVGAVSQNPTLGSHPSHRRLYLRAEPVGQTSQQDGHGQHHARARALRSGTGDSDRPNRQK